MSDDLSNEYLEDSPIYIKMISLNEDCSFAHGKRIGKLEEDYKQAKKNDQIYISFFKEITTYFLVVSTYDIMFNEFTPIICLRYSKCIVQCVLEKEVK